MRNVELYQIRDLVGQTVVGPIITVKHQGAAVRHFTDLLKDKNTIIASHPDDYELVCLGYQNEETGAIDPIDKPTAVLTGTQWVYMQQAAAAAAGDDASSVDLAKRRELNGRHVVTERA